MIPKQLPRSPPTGRRSLAHGGMSASVRQILQLPEKVSQQGPTATAETMPDNAAAAEAANRDTNVLDLGPRDLPRPMWSEESTYSVDGAGADVESPRAPDKSSTRCCGRCSLFCGVLSSRSAKILNHPVFSAITAVSTFYVLFFNDIRLLAFDKQADIVFEALSALCVCIFVFELFCRIFSETQFEWVGSHAVDAGPLARLCGFSLGGYIFSLMFLLDLLATASLFPEIDWIWGSSVVGQTAAGNFETARGSRVARAGSRLGRILRMARVSRIFRLLFNTSSRKGPWKATSYGALGSVRESQMGHKLSESVSRTVIILILPLIVLVPIFIHSSGDDGPDNLVHAAHQFSIARPDGWEEAFRVIKMNYATWQSWDAVLREDVGQPRIVYLQTWPTVPDQSVFVDLPDVYNNLRTSLSGNELQVYDLVTPSKWNSTQLVQTIAWFSTRPYVRYHSLLSIILTLFVIFLLLLGALQFTADAQKLVLQPIENMIAFVERTALDPMGTSEITSKDNTGSYETKVLENTIKKIVGILRVGFGAAGLLTVGRHLKAASPPGSGPVGKKSSDLVQPIAEYPFLSQGRTAREMVQMVSRLPQSTGDAFTSPFEPYRPGRFVRAIFVRVQIPHFDTICEVLGENAVAYSNKIAKVVHDTALAWGGSPVANTGHGYMCVWVIDDTWEKKISDAGMLQQLRQSDVCLDGAGGSLDILQGPQWNAEEDGERSGLRRRRHDRRGSLGAAITGIDLSAKQTRGKRERSVARANEHAIGSVLARSRDASTPKPSPSPSIDHVEMVGSRQTPVPSPAKLDEHHPSLGIQEHHHNPLRGSPSSSLRPDGTVPKPTAHRPLGAGGASRRSSLHLPTEDAKALLLQTASELADRALIACMKIINTVRRSPAIVDSKDEESLRKSAALRGHRLQLEFGVHVGWAIEGAAGSSHKVDAAYYSAHVEMASTMQKLCAVYGSQILFSAAFHRLLSPAAARLCRQLDSLQMPRKDAQPEDPIHIYTLDTFDWGLSVPPSNIRNDLLRSLAASNDRERTPAGRTPKPGAFARSAPTSDIQTGVLAERPLGLVSFTTLARQRQLDADVYNVRRRDLSDRERCISILGEADIIDHPIVFHSYSQRLFEDDPDIVAIHTPFSKEYNQVHYTALKLYFQGDWPAARSAFEALCPLLDDMNGTCTASAAVADRLDAASRSVYNFMASMQFIAPPHWRGCREWEEK